MHGEFMGFAMDEESIGMIRGWALRQGFPLASVQNGGAELFAQMLEAAAPPKMVMVDLDGQADPVATVQRLVSLCGAECKMIALGSANDVSLYRRIVAVGAVDYLVKPLNPDLLNQAMATALKTGGDGKPVVREARIVVVLGARGGVGSSMVAVNTAWLLAHEMRRHVALLDLDLQFGTTSLSLDLEPAHGLRDIVSSPHRVDGLMIASSMVPESDNFSILGAEETVDEFVTIDNAAIALLIKEMKNNFDVILIDMPRHLFATQKRLVAMAHDIILVTELSLVGIRDTLRFKNALKALECGSTLTIVGTRVNASRNGQISVEAFEKGTQGKIAFFVPEDTKIVTEASNAGKALGAIAKNAPITKALHALALHLSGGEAPEKQNPLLEKMKGFLNKKKKSARDIEK